MQTTDPQVRIKQELVNSIIHGFGILFPPLLVFVRRAMCVGITNPSDWVIRAGNKRRYLIRQRYERNGGFIKCKILRQLLIGYPLVTAPGGGGKA
jgi:hypothetical protein